MQNEKVALKTMKCPTCGATLKAKNKTETITCVYCGNTIVPVAESTPVIQKEPSNFSGIVKIDGIKTSSSALAYIEQLFEDYDWTSFAYAQSISIPEIDKLADSLKVSSADSKDTWLFCFKAISVPYVKKIDGINKILSSIAEEYKKDNLDAYSKFDAYKRISSVLISSKSSVILKLEKFGANAKKYGASSSELSEIDLHINTINNFSASVTYNNIEDIPDIKAFIDEKNARVVSELASKGIDAEAEYNKAKLLIEEKKYVDALNTLNSLSGYLDTDQLIEIIDRYYLFFDVLEICNKLYYYKNSRSNSDLFDLYPTSKDEVSEKPLIKNIRKIITNYGDVLYFFDANEHLKQYNFATHTLKKVCTNTFFISSFCVYNHRVFLLTTTNKLAELDLASGTVRTVLEHVKKIISSTSNKLLYTAFDKESSPNVTNVLNLDNFSTTMIGRKLTVEAITDNFVIFAKKAPDSKNKDLYIKELYSSEPPKLIEKNILEFCDTVEDKLLYYVGSKKNKSLININLDGTNRNQWSLYVNKIVFSQGGWLYSIRQAGYDSILCRSHSDGSDFSIIVDDLETYVDIKNGYFYYINDDSALIKIRMDGSNKQELCNNVESVVSVKDDKIFFISIDEKIVSELSTKYVKSLYSVDSSGKRKLVHNIKTANEYDENTIHYIIEAMDSSSDETYHDELHKIDLKTRNTEKLLNIPKKKGNSLLAGIFIVIAIIVLVVAFGYFIAAYS